MSEVQSRPAAPRGRGSARGGRAGFSNRGGRGGRIQPNASSPPPIEDDGEIAHLKKQYGGKVTMIKEMFPAWTDEDVVYALQENDGDLEITVEKITDGTITQWGEVSKTKKDRSKSKAPDSTSNTVSTFSNGGRPQRGGPDGIRGGRGRGSDRGRGRGGRGGPLGPSNGVKAPSAPLSVPTSDAWGQSLKENAPQPSTDAPAAPATGIVSSVAETVKAAVASVVPEGPKTWATLFKTAPAPKPEPKPAPKVEKAPEVAPEPEKVESAPAVEEPAPASEPKEETKTEEIPVIETSPAAVQDVIEPSKDELTETNVEQVLDASNPPPTATAASTAASSWDPRSGATSATPFSNLQGQSARPSASGYATSAQKVITATPRTASYQRRILDQEEAVRMPGNREVDRAAVQFGAFSLGAGEDDVDGDREEAETRAQPEHSPVSQPRASLPPAPAPAATPEGLPQPKEHQGLPSAPIAAPGLPSPLPGAQSMSQQGSQGSHQYNQYGRYGGQDQSAFGQKPYDPFSQQAPSAPSQYDSYSSQPNQAQQQSQSGAFSSAPSEYSQYYTADQQQRQAYQNYYGSQYGQQQSAQSQQDGPASQRTFSGYNAPVADVASPFPQSTSQTTQSRYATAGEGQNSGHTTPNPPAQSQQTTAQSTTQAQPNIPTQPQGQPGGAQQYPYGPYYNSPYYATYMNSYNQGYGGQGNYGAGPYGKGGMYNQQHGYGMSPQTAYDHTASPAAGPFSGTSLHGRESAVGGGLGDYGRAGSQQSGAQPLGGSGGFGSMDSFGRGSSYQGQSQQFGQGSQQSATDDLKTFGDAKTANGPSPSMTQAARPGSAANTAPGQSALPPPQSAQQSYGGYPSHLQQQHALHGSQSGSQYGGLGALGGQHSAGQGHQSSQYGYGQGGFGGSGYGGGYGQQRGGWGNNYQH